MVVLVFVCLCLYLQDACTTLRDLSLRHDSEAFDVHMQHHHGEGRGGGGMMRGEFGEELEDTGGSVLM